MKKTAFLSVVCGLSLPCLTSCAQAQDAAPIAAPISDSAPMSTTPQVRIASTRTSVQEGRTVLIKARVTQNGKPLSGAMLVPYVNGVRFSDPIISDEKGNASTRLPIFDTKLAVVQFDIVQRDAAGKWIGLDESTAPPDRWIWAQEIKDNQNIWLQKTFTLPSKPARASLRLGVDEEAQAFVNGQEAGKMNGWGTAAPLDVTPFLRAGENTISVLARNNSGPGSFVARLEADKTVVVSDASWKVWETAPQGWPTPNSGGAPVRVLGTLENYIITPAGWPGLANRNKLRDDSVLTPGPTVSNALNIRVTPPTAVRKVPVWDTFSDTWVATDGLGRTLPTFEEVGAPRPNKTVGIFYYIWHSHHSRNALSANQPVFDATQTILANPERPIFARATNWWHEPIFGYYNSSDRWVLRKHNQMLSDAGIDTLIHDASNEAYYWSEWLNHADLLTTLRASGQKTPDFTFLFWASTKVGFPDVSKRFYDAGLYRDLWTQWKGKPLMMADARDVPQVLADKYSLRSSWAWSFVGDWFKDGKDKWPWLDETPQAYGWHESPNKPEQLVVTPGHHAVSNKGRSMVRAVQPDKANQKPELGLQFAEQLGRLKQVDPEFLFITQWNEWVAGAYAAEPGKVFDGRVMTSSDSVFVDEYNAEFSRDLEPTKADATGAGLSDNYYYQMIDGIRRYKGVRPLAPITRKTISTSGDFSAWNSVALEFRDTLGDTAHRDAWGWGWNKRYTDTTGRNDIRSAKTTFDAKNMYFYVRTQKALTKPTSGDWMTLYLDADNNAKTGWMGYDFRVRGTELQKHSDGTWTKVASITRKMGSNEMQLSIPQSALFGSGTRPKAVDFKWTDNCENDNTWRDFLLHGDAAPNARFNYRAKFPA